MDSLLPAVERADGIAKANDLPQISRMHLK